MNNAFDLFTRAKNVLPYGTLTTDDGLELPAYVLVEPSIEEWNRKAKIQNTVMFVQTFKRSPEHYNEVLAWVYSFVDPQYIPERYKQMRNDIHGFYESIVNFSKKFGVRPPKKDFMAWWFNALQEMDKEYVLNFAENGNFLKGNNEVIKAMRASLDARYNELKSQEKSHLAVTR